MSGDPRIEKAAQRLRQARETATTCEPVRDLIGETDMAAAQSVRTINIQARIDDGARLCGRKVGFTNRAVQQAFGVDEPVLGMLFAEDAIDDGEPIAWGRVPQPVAEAEMAFVMGRDLDREDATMVDVMRAVDYVLPAIEIAATRIRDWDITATDIVADNAGAGLFVLGQEPKTIDALDMRLCGMVMSDGVEPRSTGVGAAVLGSPLNSLRWVARAAARAGRPFAAGDVVLTGSMGPVVPMVPGVSLEARIEGVGSVRAVFGPVDG